MIFFLRRRAGADLRLVARQNLRRAEYTPSTRRGDGVGADIHENSYAIDATLRRRQRTPDACRAVGWGTCTKCNFYDERLHLVRVEVRLLRRRPRPEPLGEVEDVRPLEFLLAQVIFGGAGLRDTSGRTGVVDGAELGRF